MDGEDNVMPKHVEIHQLALIQPFRQEAQHVAAQLRGK